MVADFGAHWRMESLWHQRLHNLATGHPNVKSTYLRSFSIEDGLHFWGRRRLLLGRGLRCDINILSLLFQFNSLGGLCFVARPCKLTNRKNAQDEARDCCDS